MDSSYFDELIGIHRDAITSFHRWWRILLVGGFIFLLLSLVAWFMAAAKIIDSNLAPSLVTMFGIITSAGSFLPYKEIPPRRIAIAKCRLLKKECAEIINLPKDERKQRLKEFLELINDLSTATQ
ncbi:MAG TPA: hypothetical protein VF717_04675 [Pyrinomonadaceae bacterium]|jgi:hypothetical protein